MLITRPYTLLFLIFGIALMLGLSSCFNDSKNGNYLIPLEDVLASPAPDPYQSPSKVIRGKDIVRPGAEVGADFMDSVIKNRAYRPAANIVLNGDSLQVSISTIGKAGEDRPGSSDHLYLNAWGDTLSPLAVYLGSKHFGVIGPQTIFKINRRTYLLNMLNESRSHIRISELEDARDLPVTASITTRYKKLSVLDPKDDEPVSLVREPGKRLIVLFLRYPRGAEDVLAACRAFEKLPPEVSAQTQVAVVNRYTGAPAKLKEFFRANQISFPLYFEGPGTCTNLPCHDRFPYFMEVNTAGRITEYYGWLEELGW
jgi:hypothetical protein